MFIHNHVKSEFWKYEMKLSSFEFKKSKKCQKKIIVKQQTIANMQTSAAVSINRKDQGEKKLNYNLHEIGEILTAEFKIAYTPFLLKRLKLSHENEMN